MDESILSFVSSKEVLVVRVRIDGVFTVIDAFYGLSLNGSMGIRTRNACKPLSKTPTLIPTLTKCKMQLKNSQPHFSCCPAPSFLSLSITFSFSANLALSTLTIPSTVFIASFSLSSSICSSF